MGNKNEKLDNYNKWKYTLYTTIVFLIVVNPAVYTLVNGITNGLFGVKIADNTGCPNMIGIILHALVFTLVLRLLMDLDI